METSIWPYTYDGPPPGSHQACVSWLLGRHISLFETAKMVPGLVGAGGLGEISMDVLARFKLNKRLSVDVLVLDSNLTEYQLASLELLANLGELGFVKTSSWGKLDSTSILVDDWHRATYAILSSGRNH